MIFRKIKKKNLNFNKKLFDDWVDPSICVAMTVQTLAKIVKVGVHLHRQSYKVPVSFVAEAVPSLSQQSPCSFGNLIFTLNNTERHLLSGNIVCRTRLDREWRYKSKDVLLNISKEYSHVDIWANIGQIKVKIFGSIIKYGTFVLNIPKRIS